MERRLYQRECINIEGVFIHKEAVDLNKREFCGYIYDISEGGVKLIISELESKLIAAEIAPGETICFQAVDIYELYNEKQTSVISGEVTILRKEIEADAIVFGCRFNTISDDIKQYISNKKVASYIEAGFKLTI